MFFLMIHAVDLWMVGTWLLMGRHLSIFSFTALDLYFCKIEWVVVLDDCMLGKTALNVPDVFEPEHGMRFMFAPFSVLMGLSPCIIQQC